LKPRPTLTAAIAVLLAVALAACHDEIPAASDGADASATTADSASTDPVADSTDAESQALEHRQQEELLSYGVSEQSGFPPIIHVNYWVGNGVRPWDGVSLNLTCSTSQVLVISGLSPRTEKNRATLVIRVDDQPVDTLDVWLRRNRSYGPDGQTEVASYQLDEAGWYERLRSAQRLTIRLLDSDQKPATFDLTRLFGTPFQDDIDNCGQSSVSASDG